MRRSGVHTTRTCVDREWTGSDAVFGFKEVWLGVRLCDKGKVAVDCSDTK